MKETCCDYFAADGKAFATPTSLGTAHDETEAMKMCDRMSNCVGLNVHEGTYTAVSSPSGLDYAAAETGQTLLAKGHCRRAIGGTCESKRKNTVPPEPSACHEMQEQLQSDYTLAVQSVKESMEGAKEDMSIDTLEQCRRLEISRYQAPLSELSAAVEQTVETCEKASLTVQDLTAPLVDLQGDLDSLERPGGVIAELQAECDNTAAVSTYLTDVRDAIEKLENCPGNRALRLEAAAAAAGSDHAHEAASSANEAENSEAATSDAEQTTAPAATNNAEQTTAPAATNIAETEPPSLLTPAAPP